MSRDEILFDMEMQNDSANDSIPKRSRFYQSMIDTPILKSGRTTKYRDLSSTVIIFITQEDIFGQDRAKYTFSEQCEELQGLNLEDGTQKIFLNMSSNNGSDELISLLQYMKNTTLDNPEIIVKDKRLLRIDEIVNEVRNSYEWEDFRMNIYNMGIHNGIIQGKKEGIEQGIKQGKDEGIKQGIQQGLEKGIQAFIIGNVEEGIPEERTINRLISTFDLTKEQAEEYYERFS